MKQKVINGIAILAGILAIGITFLLVFNIRKLKLPSEVDVPTSTSTITLGWNKYTSKKEPSLSFNYPNNWELTEKQTVSKNGEGIILQSQNGTTIWYEYDVFQLSGPIGCDKNEFIKSVIPLPNARNLYLVNTVNERNFEYIGIKGLDTKGNTPKMGDSGSCFYPLGFASKKYPKIKISFMSANFNQQDIKIIEEIFKSLSY